MTTIAKKSPEIVHKTPLGNPRLNIAAQLAATPPSKVTPKNTVRIHLLRLPFVQISYKRLQRPAASDEPRSKLLEGAFYD